MKFKTKILTTAVILAAATCTTQAADVKENWDKNCASCRGKDGKGDTKAGKKAQVKDLTDAKHQASFTDEKAIKQIKEGMKEGNRERMKPFASKLTDDEIKALVGHLRIFKK